MGEIYETDLFDLSGIRKFENWLDKNIGTEYERNDNGEGSCGKIYYLLIFDLEWSDIDKIRAYELWRLKND